MKTLAQVLVGFKKPLEAQEFDNEPEGRGEHQVDHEDLPVRIISLPQCQHDDEPDDSQERFINGSRVERRQLIESVDGIAEPVDS